MNMTTTTMNPDPKFHARLSAFLTSSFADQNATPTDDDALVILQGFTKTGDDVFPTDPSANLKVFGVEVGPAKPETLVELIASQRAANDGLRRLLLAPMEQAEARSGKTPSLASRTRCYRLKRVLDVHSDTANVEDEVRKVWSKITASGDATKELVRKRAVTAIEEETSNLVKEADRFESPPPGQRRPGGLHDGGRTAGHDLDGRRCEASIYMCQESVEKILKALGSLASTLDSGGSLDDVRMMLEFDAIGRRSCSSTSSDDREVPTLVNAEAIRTLLALLPPKYNPEIVLETIGGASENAPKDTRA